MLAQNSTRGSFAQRFQAIIDTYNPPKDFATPRGLPMTYLIAPDGKVAKQFLGPVNAHDIEQAIVTAGGKAV